MVRVYIFVAGDFCHVGHVSLFERAKKLGDVLVVGVPSDETVRARRGFDPIVGADMRAGLFKGVRYVDEVLLNAPCVTSISWMDEHGLDVCVTSDDDAADAQCAEEVAKAGMLHVLPKEQESPSSSSILYRIRATGDPNCKLKTGTSVPLQIATSASSQESFRLFGADLASSGNDVPCPSKGARVYAAVTADLFHVGHVNFLRQASACGAHLTVGVCSDELVESYKRRPCFSTAERVALVSSCRYVDRVLPNAPSGVTDAFMVDMGIDIVAHGNDYTEETVRTYFAEPAARGCTQAVQYTSGISTTDIMKRCLEYVPAAAG